MGHGDVRCWRGKPSEFLRPRPEKFEALPSQIDCGPHGGRYVPSLSVRGYLGLPVVTPYDSSEAATHVWSYPFQRERFFCALYLPRGVFTHVPFAYMVPLWKVGRRQSCGERGYQISLSAHGSMQESRPLTVHNKKIGYPGVAK